MLASIARILAFSITPLLLQVQPAQDDLSRTLTRLDAELFDSYNKCDLTKNRGFFDDNVEFYHDQGGVTVGADKLVAQLKQNVCGKVRRELVPGSLEVHPIKGYGAVQIGVHRFYNPPNAAKPGGEAKFIHLWHNQNGVWKITRVYSIDHAPIP